MMIKEVNSVSESRNYFCGKSGKNIFPLAEGITNHFKHSPNLFQLLLRF